MGAAPTCAVVHSSFGRLRVHFSRWPVQRAADLTGQLCRVGGIQKVEANPVTGNVLLLYEPRQTTAEKLLRALPEAVQAANAAGSMATAEAAPPPADCALREERIPVRGLERDPSLGAQVVERLRHALGVRAWVSLLTGQVHVAYDHTRVRLEDIRASVEGLQDAHVPGEDRPRHPLDPDPLRDGINRVVGGVIAVGLLTMQRLIAPQLLPAGVIGTAAGVAGVLNLVQGFPVLRDTLRGVLGRRPADLLTTGTARARGPLRGASCWRGATSSSARARR